MRRQLLLASSFAYMMMICTSSCNSNNKNEIILQELNNGLLSSNAKLYASCENMLATIKTKADEYLVREKARDWLPKAQSAKDLSVRMVKYLDSVKNVLSDKTQDSQQSINEVLNTDGIGKAIHQRLVSYKNAVLSIDQKIQDQLTEGINNILFSKDSLIDTEEFQQKYFKDITKEEVLPFLTLLQNRVLLTENTCIQFAIEQLVHTGHDDFYAFEAIVGQNAKILEAGDELEITAGLGNFSRSQLPRISINNRVLPLNEKGLVVHKMRTPKKAGNYSMPVEVGYVDEDGKEREYTFNVEYRVIKSIE